MKYYLFFKNKIREKKKMMSFDVCEVREYLMSMII